MRSVESIKNSAVLLSTQAIILSVQFISRTVFIKTLGAEYLGINGLFSNLLSMLSLAELGLGTAISYALYKPIAEDNREEIKSLLHFFKRCYFIIGGVVILLGFLLMPFLPHFIKGEVNVPVNIYFVYLCFLANSVITYFFAHKRIIIDNSQNKRITASIDFALNMVVSAIQILILLKLQNYILFLLVKIIGSIAASVIIAFVANKKYAFIIETTKPISEELRKKIYYNVSILFLGRIGGLVVFGTDFLIISAFVGLSVVGIYSNYTLIINTVAMIGNLIIQACGASIGNAVATLNKKEIYAVFKKISFLIFAISGICSVCLLNLINPFIEIWAGADYLLSDSVVYVIVANYFFSLNRTLVWVFKDCAGIFKPDRYKPIVEIVFNMGLSLFLVQYLGVIGVLIGTLANTLFVCIWVESYLVHKYIFENSVFLYVRRYLVQCAVLAVSLGLTFYANSFVENFVGKCTVSLGISSAVYFVFFCRTAEFEYFIELGKRTLRK
ncbi:sugar translocase [Fibrobacterales bacterium]|nr:sugar translocase [Fibrobacterales bacterium]